MGTTADTTVATPLGGGVQAPGEEIPATGGTNDWKGVLVGIAAQ